MTTTDPEQNEILRKAVLEHLATRHPTAHTAPAIRRRLEREVDFEPFLADVEAALKFLAGMTPPLAKSEPDSVGSTAYWSATSEGVLAWERSQTSASRFS